MKKGFTMIELIFVIVILGILAAVAIPRLAATRDDAEVAKAATNLSTLVSDLGAYYTSQAQWADSIANMTNVVVNGTGYVVTLQAAGKDCLKVELNSNTSNLTITNGTVTTGICESVQKNPSVAKMVSSSPISVKGKSVQF
ncbi:MAG: type II secretion system protein [Campylobacter sp.]